MTTEASNGTAQPETEQTPLQQFMAIANANGGLDDGPAVIDAEEPAKEADNKPEAPKPDWAALREERRNWKAQADRREAALAAKEAEIEARAKAAEATSPERIMMLLEGGNFDAVAQAIGAKSWEDLNNLAARAFASPEFKRMRNLEERAARLESERARERQQIEAQRQEVQRQEAERQFVSHIETEMKSSGDVVVRTLATEEPEFVAAVYSHMANHYLATGEELDVSEVAQTIVSGLKSRLTRWMKIQGLQPTQPQQAEPTQVVTPDRARSTKPAKKSRDLTHAEWIAMAAREMKKAVDQDISEGKF